MKKTVRQKTGEYAKRRGKVPTLAAPAFKDISPPTIRDYAALSPLSIGKDEGPFILNPVPRKRKIRP